MRIIEPEAKSIAYLIIIAGLVTSYFGLYILTTLLFVSLLVWLFFCSSKIINPTIPSAIVSPISGVIKKIEKDSNHIEFQIKARFNGRIYAPNDLQNIRISHHHGFYTLSNHSAFGRMFAPKDILEADSIFANNNLRIKIEVMPNLFRFCGLNYANSKSLFLEKIGFLNTGSLSISIYGDNLESFAQEGSYVVGGNSPLVVIKSPDSSLITPDI
ncbi:hypothetical protein CQA53_00925 [Helicobacter didelphidarum]|uniref:Phosphatidylserine decarboxylase n=1 Tax=Helicobacter didelphidarum TaxID=2040648 RepID=A0A3D8ISN3_9HELI|nr:hypothetical protein [Helicobacter didelphidarum]RDU67601.1 hypothetical protein CQA53_00925 [Helicobacter didelphidarum]